MRALFGLRELLAGSAAGGVLTSGVLAAGVWKESRSCSYPHSHGWPRAHGRWTAQPERARRDRLAYDRAEPELESDYTKADAPEMAGHAAPD